MSGSTGRGKEAMDLSEVQLYVPLYHDISLTKGCYELLGCRSETMHRCKEKLLFSSKMAICPVTTLLLASFSPFLLAQTFFHC